MGFLQAVRVVHEFISGEEHDWRIVGHLRTGGTETIYEGRDYCNVSDMMPNSDEPDKKYGRVQLFEDGVLVEDVSPPMPRGRA